MKSIQLNRNSYERFLNKHFPLQGYYNNLQIKIIKGVSIALVDPMTNNILKSIKYSDQSTQYVIEDFNKLKPQPIDENFPFQFTLSLIQQEKKK